jgi:O-antigen/teichoic acid export membrane protein
MNIAKYFIGEKFHEGLQVVPILLFANLFLGVYLNLSMWYKLSGKTKYGAWFSIVGAIITIVLNFLLIPKMGYMGAAWATFICYGAIMVISYIYGQKHYAIPYSIMVCASIVLFSVVLWQVSNYVLISFNTGIMMSVLIKLIAISIFTMLSWMLLKPSSTVELVDEQ